VATIALFLVLGGVSYAAFHLPKNSVRSKNIVNHKVKANDLAKPPAPQSAGLVSATDCSSASPDQWIAQNPDLYGNLGYYRDLDGQVHLTGVAQKCGSPPGGAVVFRLAPGYRAQITQMVPVALNVANGGTTNAFVYDDGEVAVNASNKDAASLAGISFRCAPPGKHGCPP
jgi:hypothetical protein